jgi:hypothetical protein
MLSTAIGLTYAIMYSIAQKAPSYAQCKKFAKHRHTVTLKSVQVLLHSLVWLLKGQGCPHVPGDAGLSLSVRLYPTRKRVYECPGVVVDE